MMSAAKSLDLFLNDAEGLLPRVRSALTGSTQPQWDEALRALHTFKGNAAALGQPALSRYAHTLESALGRFKGGTWRWNAPSAQALILALEALSSALVLLRAGDEPDFGSAVRTFAVALKNAQSSAAEPGTATLALVPRPSTPHSPPGSAYVLLVRVGGEEFTLPVLCVEEVIHRPEILPVAGTLFRPFEGSASLAHPQLVRSNGRLLPLLSVEALLPAHVAPPARASRASLPWVVILRHQGSHERRDMALCLPVDEVIQVCHADESGVRARALTSDSIRDAAEKIAS